ARVLHSFPTRRSSDLGDSRVLSRRHADAHPRLGRGLDFDDFLKHFLFLLRDFAPSWFVYSTPNTNTTWPPVTAMRCCPSATNERSEEHTSELQSPDHL